MSARVIDLPVVVSRAQPPRRPSSSEIHAVRVVDELRPIARQFLADIGQYLGNRGVEVLPIERGLSVWNVTGQTTLTLEPVYLSASTGRRVAEVIRIRTEITADGVRRPNARQRALLNTAATLGALLPDPATGRPVVVSRITTHANDDLSGAYGWITACAMHSHPDWLRSLHVDSEPEASPNEPPAASRWQPGDLGEACEVLREAGLEVRRNSTKICAEIPWGEGAVSRLLGHETMLLKLASDVPHPVLGPGLFCRLELPGRYQKRRLGGVVDCLNRFEWDAIDAPPLLGAWCSRISTGTVEYVSFFPNRLWGRNCTPVFTTWLYQRAQIIREAVINNRL